MVNGTLARMVRLVQEECGSELVEFAFTIPVLFALFFGIMDFSRAMYCYHYVSYAAQEGARYAMVRGADTTSGPCKTSAPPNFTETFNCEAASSDVQNYVTSRMLPLIDPSLMTVVTTWPGTTPGSSGNSSSCSGSNGSSSGPQSQGCMVEVQVKYAFTFLLPFLPRSAAINFSSTSEKVIQ